jgi:hypothetical protein
MRYARAVVDHVGTSAFDELGAVGVAIVNVDSVGVAEAKRLVERTGGRCLIVAQPRDREGIAEIVASTGATSVLARGALLESGEFVTSLKKLMGADVFGIEKYFPWGVRTTELSLRGTGDKSATLRAAEMFFESAGAPLRVVQAGLTVLDEFITNGIFNAPIDAKGARPFAQLPRTNALILPADKKLTVKLCSDGGRLGVSLTDLYGSLSRERIAQVFARRGALPDAPPSSSSGGSGIGLYYVLSLSAHLVFNCARARRTEVISIIELDEEARRSRTAGKALAVFGDNNA